ncbi:hypothetical protein SERLA73DRAFT_170049 [Serpula lacrymans var. lacrymans S7.3]|uniref:Rho-GAP domain-containing protein n=2 Tax=Serpula lacrymans var. lacrymans TaxID=341189 RepID=F8Q4X2_SERL3|nr:uncharacterized protein SERLADRAFT_451054 [Serpula lacrymans var. lacrymans S7.9]EGN96599.1 hypothetical protein SERLA73DRAFT_170049 [Serpula lacrymans var. lacrymans S7.3]EGO22169.1 hypothetical protein SERLADRAFT_451054 [Serpula lacrymans var. lacrymans S7.9]
MAVLSLPLTFTNSFWTQDYRKGLEVLYSKLEQGVAENDEIVAFIRARATLEKQLATALSNPAPTGTTRTGFSSDDGASLLMAFRGLQAESVAHGEAHKLISKDLQVLVADPFDEWAQSYKGELSKSRSTAIDNWLRSYEQSQKEVIKLKNSYLQKMRRADEAEDDAKFAPNNDLGDKYTTSPRLAPRDARSPPQRTSSVQDRITQRFKEIQRKAASSSTESDTNTNETLDEKELPKIDKGKGKAVEVSSPRELTMSPPPLSPPLPPARIDIVPPESPMPPAPPSPILLAGLSLPPSAISALLIRAASELNLRPVRFPLLGEYQKCFSGDEFVEWLNANVQGFGGSLELAEEAARDLTEREDLLRRIGEFGNNFEATEEAFYQFRPKAFDLEGKGTDSGAAPKRNLAPIADNLLKRSNTLVNVVAKALNNNTNGQSEPAYVRLRREADDADKTYRVAVRKLDRQRLGLEERIEEVLKTLQRWEAERLRAVKTVLLQYQGTLAHLPKAIDASIERSGTLVAAFQPESDLTALIERYRTGPFRPVPQLYESVAHDESDVVFGIDLRKWAEGGWNTLTTGEDKREHIPPVLTALLDGLTESYKRLPNDAEKRKAWIYDVPLPAVHHLRESLNAIPPEQPFSLEMLEKYDAAVIAGAIKLWALELDPPLALWEGWEDIRKLYPTVGSSAKPDGDVSEEQHIQDLQVALQRLPKVHLFVLDAIIIHLRSLIETTKVEEADEIYITKLALSVGRTIIRPKYESQLSVQDRHPTLLFIDLVKNYTDILPPTIEKKKREAERRIPVRKRTAPIDMRMSRSRISVGGPTREIIAAQQAAQKMAVEKVSQPFTLEVSSEVSQPHSLPQVPVSSKPESPAEVIPSPVTSNISVKPPTPVRTPPAPASSEDFGHLPARPVFKEPPPEDEDFPPRPSFKEPPPELDDAPPQPRFVSPPPSPPPEVQTEEKIPSPVVGVTPPTPQNASAKILRRQSAIRSSSPSSAARTPPSPTPSSEDQTLGTGRTSLSRSGSGQTGVRGPRLSRGPRVHGGGSVSSLVSNFNKNSASPPPSPGYKRLSGSPRPTSLLSGSGQDSKPRSVGRGAAFSRRTMASDAEDEVVDK